MEGKRRRNHGPLVQRDPPRTSPGASGEADQGEPLAATAAGAAPGSGGTFACTACRCTAMSALYIRRSVGQFTYLLRQPVAEQAERGTM